MPEPADRAPQTTDPLVLLDLDSALTPDEQDIQHTVARFVHYRVRPHVAEWYDEARFPHDLVPELGKLGVLCMHLTGHGCAGTNATSYGLAAIDSVVHARWGRMVSLSGTTITHVAFEDALGKLNTVPQSRYDEAAILFG